MAFNEQHNSVKHYAELWGWSETVLREIFKNEPGVPKVERPEDIRKRKRGYCTMQIPDSIARRVYERLTRPSRAA